MDGRIPHAQLFYGPEGSGNLAIALAYAQFLNCRDRQADDSCGRCPSCLQFQKLAHPDLHFIYPVATTTNVKDKPKSLNFIQEWREFILTRKAYVNLDGWYSAINIERKQAIINKDDCNEIVRVMGYKSYESEYKVMVIWMIEKLFPASAPKILKILEEPPDKTVFLMITENLDHILSTILSRSQIIKVPKIKDEDLMKYLETRYDKKETEMRQAVNLSDGNLIEALNCLDNEGDEAYYEDFRKWMLLCYQNKITELQPFIEEHAQFTREKLKSYLQYGTVVFRYCYHLNVIPSPKIRMEGGELTFVKNFSKYIHSGNILKLFQLLNDAIFHIERNANASILLMDLSLQIGKQLKIQAPQNNK